MSNNDKGAEMTAFTVTPNAYDVRIECNVCHASKSGSLARAWAHSHADAHAEGEVR